VNKLDLAKGLPEHAKLCGLRPKALIVVGPIGALWGYNVAVLLEDGEGVRVNSLAMPQYFYADFDPMPASPHTSQLIDRVNALLAKTEATYRHGRAVPAPAAE
jgi:hypothetical protein